jgi:hypothetical protein
VSICSMFAPHMVFDGAYLMRLVKPGSCDVLLSRE